MTDFEAKYLYAKRKFFDVQKQNQLLIFEINEIKHDFRSVFGKLGEIIDAFDLRNLLPRLEHIALRIKDLEYALAGLSACVKMPKNDCIVEVDTEFENELFVEEANQEFEHSVAEFNEFEQQVNKRVNEVISRFNTLCEFLANSAASYMEVRLPNIGRLSIIMEKLNTVDENVQLYKQNITRETYTSVKDLFDRILVYLTSRESNFEGKILSIYEQIERIDIKSKQIALNNVEELKNTKLYELQRDDCINEINNLCSAIKDFQQRELLQKEKFKEQLLEKDEEIEELRLLIQEYEFGHNECQGLLFKIKKELQCEDSDILAYIQEEQEVLRNQGKDIAKIPGLQEEILAYKSEINQLKEENMLLLEDKNDLQEITNVKLRDNNSQSMKMQTEDAIIKQKDKEIAMLQSSNDIYEYAMQNITFKFADLGINVINDDISHALDCYCAKFKETLKVRIGKEVTKIGDIKCEIKELQAECNNRALPEAINDIELLYTEQQTLYAEKNILALKAIEKERKYCAAMIDQMVEMPVQIQQLDINRLNVAMAKLSKIEERLLQAQTEFELVVKNVQEIQVVHQYIKK